MHSNNVVKLLPGSVIPSPTGEWDFTLTVSTRYGGAALRSLQSYDTAAEAKREMRRVLNTLLGTENN
jgi:hypothetical protein